MADSGFLENQNRPHSPNGSQKKNRGKFVSHTASRKLDGTNADIYCMCKKIAQLTKVVYNLNVKNDELETYHARLQYDYEKKIWKLSADIQQHATNAVSMIRAEAAQSAELSQAQTQLQEQTAAYQQLSEQLATARQQHGAELELAAADAERRLTVLRAELTADVATCRHQLERCQQQLEAADGQLAVTRTERAHAQKRLTELARQLQVGRQQTEEVQCQLTAAQQNGEQWRTESERRASAESELGRQLAAQTAAHLRDLEKLHDQQTNQQRQLEERANQVSAGRERETELERAAAALAADRDRLAGELSTAGGQLQQRQTRLEQQESQLEQQESRLEQQESRLQEMAERVTTCAGQLQAARAALEAAQLEVRQRTGELARAEERQQRLQADTAAAKGRSDQLSQRLLAKDGEVSQLEARLVTAASASGGGEVEVELTAAWQRVQLAERQRAEQAQLLQSALQDSADMEAQLRGQLDQLRTTTAEREQQLMEDVETRVREVRSDCKHRLEEQQRQAEERVLTERQSAETELQSRRQALQQRETAVSRKLDQLETLRSSEAEVVQLRGLTHELMRELRVGTRQVELARTQEARVSEENRQLTELVSRQASIKEQRHQWEQQVQRQLEQSRAAQDAAWEDRLREDRSRLKAELDCLHAEEKHLAVESMRLGREQQLQETEQRARQLEQQLTAAQAELLKREAEHRHELEQCQAQTETVVGGMRQQLELLRENLADLEHGGGSAALSSEPGPNDADVSSGNCDEGGGDAGDTGDIVGRHRREIEAALRHRPDLQGALSSLLAEGESQVVLAQQELRLALELRDCDHAEHGEQMQTLQDQLDARDRLADRLLTELGQTRRDLEQITQRATALDQQGHSQLQTILADSRRQLDTLEQKHQLQLVHMRTQSQSAAEEADEKIKHLEALAAEAQTRCKAAEGAAEVSEARAAAAAVAEARVTAAHAQMAAVAADARPQDRETIGNLRRALTERERELAAAGRDRQRLELELANRDASYSRLFAPTAPRVGVIDPMAAAASARQQRRQLPPGRSARR